MDRDSLDDHMGGWCIVCLVFFGVRNTLRELIWNAEFSAMFWTPKLDSIALRAVDGWKGGSWKVKGRYGCRMTRWERGGTWAI